MSRRFNAEQYRRSLVDGQRVWSMNIDGIHQTAFGELPVAALDPVVQVMFLYNINADEIDTTTNGSGTVTQSDDMAIVSSGAATSSGASLFTKETIRYKAGQGILARFSVIWGTPAEGNTQTAGMGDANDGFMFGYNGTEFSIGHRKGGTDTWVAQTDWNVDSMDGSGPSGMTLDTTKGNVYQIQYQWLGFGPVDFFIEDDSNGSLQLVHRLLYHNRNTEVSVSNPNLPLCVTSVNTTNDSNVQVKAGSMGGFVQGMEHHTGLRKSVNNTKTGVTTTETNILTIRNKSTYQSVTNRVTSHIDFINTGVATSGNNTVTLRGILNATLGGTPSYSDVSTNTSPIEYDTAGTTITGGTEWFTAVLAADSAQNIDIDHLDLRIAPGDTFTLAAAPSGGTAEVGVSISWHDEF